MRLSINLFLVIFLAIFTISQVTQAQRPPVINKPIEGLTDVKTGTNGNMELEFTFKCDNSFSTKELNNIVNPDSGRQDSSEYCKSTLIDDDGLGSVTAVVSELRREIECQDHLSQADWNVIRSFLSERAEHLRSYCYKTICNSQPNSRFSGEGGLGSRTDNLTADVTVMANCGRIATGIERFLRLSSSHPNPIIAPSGPIYANNRRKVSFREILQPLRELFATGEMYTPPGRFHEYNVTHHSNGVTRREFLWNTRRSDAPAIARHHVRSSDPRRSIDDPLCNGIRDGRLADLLRQRQGSSSSSSNNESRGGRGTR